MIDDYTIRFSYFFDQILTFNSEKIGKYKKSKMSFIKLKMWRVAATFVAIFSMKTQLSAI